MKKELTIKIAGEAGQGMQTIGFALCKMFKNLGLDIFANQDYMSRIRGGNNFFQVRVSNEPLYALRRDSDIVVALDKQSVSIHGKNISSRGLLILDRNKFNITEEGKKFLDAPMYELAIKTGGSELFVNSVALGIIAGLCKIEFSAVEKILKDIFSDKSQEIIGRNLEAAKAGYDFSRDKFREGFFVLKQKAAKEGLLLNGNESLALGAVRAGCKFYSGYPMTPSTGIMDNMAHFSRDFDIVVEQAEDEIAAINMVIGASFTGSRAMTATSGGGFCLMVEGLSLAGMTETPVVMVDAQRPAPATGFPTRTEQADLGFLIHAGHGEFARVVLAPGTIEEAFYLTVKAFNLAEKYQIPVLILTDQHLADSYRNIKMFDLKRAQVKRYIISKEESAQISGYRRYAFTASGISPRAVPSWINDVIYVDSDEHNEEGHITEDALTRNKMVEKRFHKKMQGLTKEIIKPAAYNIERADIILVGFGSTFGVMKEACDSLKKPKTGFLHLPWVWPFPHKEVTGLLRKGKKIITVENNAAGQLARLIRQETGIKADKSILKFDGRPFDLDYLIERLKKEK
ncbi:MAG: 2-oxoacid:acceptor oxidoreductase subunit alpha [Candidatus Omnitrophota bacterium]